MSAPYKRPALAISRDGSAMWGAPRSWTMTSACGQPSMRAPVQPA